MMAHNTQLTQESWGLTSALQYNVSNVFEDRNTLGSNQVFSVSSSPISRLQTTLSEPYIAAGGGGTTRRAGCNTP